MMSIKASACSKKEGEIRTMASAVSNLDWPIDRLGTETTSAVYRYPHAGDWMPARAELHAAIIDRLLCGFSSQQYPEIVVVVGGVGSGKSRLIRTQLRAQYQDALVLDADRMWRDIPEYDALAEADWRSAGNRTYSELRYLRDAALAEAAARRLNIILETPGSEQSVEVVEFLKGEGYRIVVAAISCRAETAHQRMRARMERNPTPEDNLWGSPPDPAFPDRCEYQNVEPRAFLREYRNRKARLQAKSDVEAPLELEADRLKEQA